MYPSKLKLASAALILCSTLLCRGQGWPPMCVHPLDPYLYATLSFGVERTGGNSVRHYVEYYLEGIYSPEMWYTYASVDAWNGASMLGSDWESGNGLYNVSLAAYSTPSSAGPGAYNTGRQVHSSCHDFYGDYYVDADWAQLPSGFSIQRPAITSGPQNLWYFNGATPGCYPTSAYYEAETNCPTCSPPTWVDGSGHFTVPVFPSTSAQITTRGASGCNGQASRLRVSLDGFESEDYTVNTRTANHASYWGTVDYLYQNGYQSLWKYQLVDNCSSTMPNLEVNEIFPLGHVYDDPNSNWPSPTPQAGGSNENGVFYDDMRAFGQGVPMPLNPLPPLGNYKVMHGTVEFRAGHLWPGTGTYLTTKMQQYYQDHGSHQ